MEEERIKAEGRCDGIAYNESHPEYGEHEAVKRAIYFLEKTGASALILHVTNAEDLKTIHDAKERGVTAISLEATDMGRPLYEKYGFVKMNDEMELQV